MTQPQPFQAPNSIPQNLQTFQHGLTFQHYQATNELPPHQDFNDQSQKITQCPQCKGHKYGFTDYFHNTSIFPTPPHNLIAHIEQSYLLKNRLSGLLITYTMRPPIPDHAAAAEKGIKEWEAQVQCLVREVFRKVEVEGFRLSAVGTSKVEAVMVWSREVARYFCEAVWGRRVVDMSRGNLRRLLTEFRKLWEGVWVATLEEGMAVRGRGEAA